MVNVQKHGNGFRAEVYFRSRLRKFWLGKCSKTEANGIAKHIEQLRLAAELGHELPSRTVIWLGKLGPRLKAKLIEHGLLGTESKANTLDAFIGQYFDSRTDWSDSTRSRWENVRRHANEQLGKDRFLPSVTQADAEAFARWARLKFKSKSHSGKVIADVRQIFAAALKSRVTYENPFLGIDASQPHDKDREFYVLESVADELIDNATTHYAAVIASARYGAVRVPSELLTLKWTDINWESNRVRITDSKRKTERIVPLFPKWRSALDALWAQAPDGAVHVFDESRSSANKTYRKWVLDLMDKQKIKPWPKLFQNMRASRETDLKRQFPGEAHVVCYWVGNSETVAAKHYDRIHDDHYHRAISG